MQEVGVVLAPSPSTEISLDFGRTPWVCPLGVLIVPPCGRLTINPQVGRISISSPLTVGSMLPDGMVTTDEFGNVTV